MLNRNGVWALFAIIAIFVIVHMTGAPADRHPSITGSIMLGGIAFLFMTVSILLSTRLAIFEDMFGGLDRSYQVHRTAGVIASLFVLVHFFTSPKELPAGADPIANAMVPSSPMGMLAMIFLIIGLFVALNRKIRYSTWRPLHKFMALVYVFIIAHFMTAPSVFVDHYSNSGLILIVAAALGVIAMIYSLFGMNRRTAVAYEIDQINPMERATEVVLKAQKNSIDFKPGKFAFIEVQGKAWNEPHPFTISSAPTANHLRFTIKVSGDWTRKVREALEVGTEVLVRGPYGRFDSAIAGKNQVWIAGGIGVTPFLSTIRAMDKGDDRNVTFVYATRNKDEALFLDEIQKQANDLGTFRVISLLSDEGNFANIDVLKDTLDQPLTDYDYFMCGPIPMIDGLMKDLKASGVQRRRIHTEAFEFR
jgi:predicted ferric reductase